jgi:hypothetical protein
VTIMRIGQATPWQPQTSVTPEERKDWDEAGRGIEALLATVFSIFFSGGIGAVGFWLWLPALPTAVGALLGAIVWCVICGFGVVLCLARDAEHVEDEKQGKREEWV